MKQPEKQKIIDYMFKNGRQYKIPVYQRNYTWDYSNCKELFDDIINSSIYNKDHFLGTFVQYENGLENNIEKFLIIDGQQRLTTINILLKKLLDITKIQKTKDKIKKMLFNYKENGKISDQDINKIKLKPVESDLFAFNNLMENELSQIANSNIKTNYETFDFLINQLLQKEIKSKPETNLENIITMVMDGLKHLEFIIITLEANDEPQTIFDRINSTGQELELVDKIRNYLLMEKNNQDYFYSTYWKPMEDLLGSDGYLNDFILNYLSMISPNFKRANAYISFKTYLKSNNLKPKQILIELQRYSKYYYLFQTSNKNEYSKNIRDFFIYLRKIKQTTIYPFLFRVFDDFNNMVITEDILIKILYFFLNYLLRRSLLAIPTNSLRALFNHLYFNIFGKINHGYKDEAYLNEIYKYMRHEVIEKDIFPSDDKFINALKNNEIYLISKEGTHLLLNLLENADSKEKIFVDSSKISIEHIMPQNTNNDNPQDENAKQWQKDLGNEWQRVYTTYLHTLGNLSLTGYNSEYSDKPFTQKLKLLEQYSKFKYLNNDVVNRTIWNEDAILYRSKKLINRTINNVLKIPNEFLNIEKKQFSPNEASTSNAQKTNIAKHNIKYIDDVNLRKLMFQLCCNYLDSYKLKYDIIFVKNDSVQKFIRFFPKDIYEKNINKGDKGWINRINPLLAFELINIPNKNIGIKIMLGPTTQNQDLRRNIFDEAILESQIFKCKGRKYNAVWRQIDLFDICTSLEEQNITVQNLDDFFNKCVVPKLNDYFENYLPKKTKALSKILNK